VSAVRVTGTDKASLCFAGLLGIRNANVRARATVQVATSLRAVLKGLSPFAVPEDSVGAVGSTMTFYPGDTTSYSGGLGSDSVVPGNWGLLNLNGGSLSTQDLIDEILRAGLQKTIDSVIGQALTVAVYSTVAGNGANGEFTIVGFVSVTILDCRLNGNNPYATCTINEYTALHDVTAGGGYISPNVRKVQLVQ
jgi:hypothetical protein